MKYRFYYLIMCTTIISHFILYAPYLLKGDLYKGTGTVIFIMLVVACINAYMTVYVYNSHKDYILLDINKLLLGNFIGKVSSVITILGNLTIGFFMYRGMLEIINRFMLPSTPIAILAPTVLLIFYVNVLHSNESFLRFIGFISLIIILWVFIYLALCTKSFHFYYAKATFIHSFNKPKLITIGAASFYYTGVSHLALFNKQFGKISWKATVYIYIFVGLTTAILAAYLPAGMLGPYEMQKILFTVASSADTISIDLFITERALYILLPWMFMLGVSDMIIWAFVGWGLIRDSIPNKKKSFIIFNIICLAYNVFAVMLKSSKQVLVLGGIAISIALAYHYFSITVLFIITKLKEGKKT